MSDAQECGCVPPATCERCEAPREGLDAFSVRVGPVMQGAGGAGVPEPSADGAAAEPAAQPLAVQLAAWRWEHRGAELAARVAARHRGEDPPIPTPWRSLSLALAGIDPADDTGDDVGPVGWRPGAYFLTAGTGVGKSQFAMECAVHAARGGTPALYLALELDDLGLYTRGASLVCGDTDDTRGTPWERTRWSELYQGRVAAIPEGVTRELAALPLYPVEPDAHAWGYEDLDAYIAAMREAEATRRAAQGLPALDANAPVFVVLDFLQLVGPSRNNAREDLRERVGRAAYRARMVARNLRAVVLCLSSIARAQYGATIIDPTRADGPSEDPGSGAKRGAMRSEDDPDTAPKRPDPLDLVGLGKESGDVEFSADGVLVLCPHKRAPRVAGEKRPEWSRVEVCIAKLRAGPAGVWCPLEFNGTRFREAPREAAEELGPVQLGAEPPRRGRGRNGTGNGGRYGRGRGPEVQRDDGPDHPAETNDR